MGLDNNDYRDFLMHYGVKGMRWGKRKSKYVDDEYIKNLTANSHKNSYPSGFKSASSLKTRPKPNSLYSVVPSGRRRNTTKDQGNFISKRITGSYYTKERDRNLRAYKYGATYGSTSKYSLGGSYKYFDNKQGNYSPAWRKQVVDMARSNRIHQDKAEKAVKEYGSKSLFGIVAKTVNRGKNFISKLFKRKK